MAATRKPLTLNMLKRYRRMDASSIGLRMNKKEVWRDSWSGLYDEFNNKPMRFTANNATGTHLLWFTASVDINGYVHKSSGLHTLDLRL